MHWHHNVWRSRLLWTTSRSKNEYVGSPTKFTSPLFLAGSLPSSETPPFPLCNQTPLIYYISHPCSCMAEQLFWEVCTLCWGYAEGVWAWRAAHTHTRTFDGSSVMLIGQTVVGTRLGWWLLWERAATLASQIRRGDRESPGFSGRTEREGLLLCMCVCFLFFFLENIRGVFAQSETESEQGHVGAVQWSAPCLCVCLAEDAEMCLSFTWGNQLDSCLSVSSHGVIYDFSAHFIQWLF